MEKRKNTGLIVTIIILVIALLGTSGFIVYDKFLNTSNSKNNKIENNKTNIEKNEPKDEKISQFTDDDLNNLYNKVYSLYTYSEYFDNCIWKNESGECFKFSESDYGNFVEISNYDEIMSSILTENGIKEYEKVLEVEELIQKRDNKTFMLVPVAALGDLSIKGDLKIDSTDEKEINVSATYDFPETGEKKTHQFKVIYENDKWLIDSYPLAQYYFSK